MCMQWLGNGNEECMEWMAFGHGLNTARQKERKLMLISKAMYRKCVLKLSLLNATYWQKPHKLVATKYLEGICGQKRLLEFILIEGSSKKCLLEWECCEEWWGLQETITIYSFFYVAIITDVAILTLHAHCSSSLELSRSSSHFVSLASFLFHSSTQCNYKQHRLRWNLFFEYQGMVMWLRLLRWSLSNFLTPTYRCGEKMYISLKIK